MVFDSSTDPNNSQDNPIREQHGAPDSGINIRVDRLSEMLQMTRNLGMALHFSRLVLEEQSNEGLLRFIDKFMIFKEVWFNFKKPSFVISNFASKLNGVKRYDLEFETILRKLCPEGSSPSMEVFIAAVGALKIQAKPHATISLYAAFNTLFQPLKETPEAFIRKMRNRLANNGPNSKTDEEWIECCGYQLYELIIKGALAANLKSHADRFIDALNVHPHRRDFCEWTLVKEQAEKIFAGVVSQEVSDNTQSSQQTSSPEIHGIHGTAESSAKPRTHLCCM